jgi:hypothetical protein
MAMSMISAFIAGSKWEAGLTVAQVEGRKTLFRELVARFLLNTEVGLDF